MEQKLPHVVRCGPSLVSTYLWLLPEQQKNAYWHQVLNVITSFSTRETLDWLDKFNDKRVTPHLQPSQGFELFIKKTILMALENQTSDLKQVLSLLERSGLCLLAYFQSPLAYP